MIAVKEYICKKCKIIYELTGELPEILRCTCGSNEFMEKVIN